jgi:hypothetical protein
MKCGAGQHKLKVYATNGRYIIRNGIICYISIFLSSLKLLIGKKHSL